MFCWVKFEMIWVCLVWFGLIWKYQNCSTKDFVLNCDQPGVFFCPELLSDIFMTPQKKSPLDSLCSVHGGAVQSSTVHWINQHCDPAMMVTGRVKKN